MRPGKSATLPESGQRRMNGRLELPRVSHFCSIYGWPFAPSLRYPFRAMGQDSNSPLLVERKDPMRWFHDEIQPHESSLRSYLRGLFPSLSDLDDLVQETYLRLIRAHEKGRISYAKAFLFTTARNAALDIFRRRKLAVFEPIADDSHHLAADDIPDASEALNRQQEMDMLAEAMKTLPPRCRQTLTLRLLYGMPAREIADQLGISEFTVKAQLAKGMRRCTDYFEARGIIDGPSTAAGKPHP